MIRIILVLIAAFALAACSENIQQPPSLNDDNQVGAVQVRFMRAPSKGTDGITARILSEPSTVRIVIINRITGFRVAEDYPVPATVEAQISVPVASGYEVHGVSFTNDAYANLFGEQSHMLLKYASQTGISVSAKETTSVSLSLQQISTNLTYPSTAQGGEQISVKIASHPALSNSAIYGSTRPITTSDRYFDVETLTSSQLSISFNVPAVESNSRLYLLSRNYLNADLLRTGEAYGQRYNYSFYSPNPSAGEAQVSLTIEPPLATIGVNVTY